MRLLSTLSAGVLALSASQIASAANPTTPPIAIGTQPGTLETAARQALVSSRPDVVGLEWGTPRVVELNSGQRIVKFPQMSHGLRVVQRGAVIRFGKTGAVEHVSARVEKALPTDLTPSVAKSEAIRAAGVEGDSVEAALALWPTGDGTKLVWMVAPGALLSFSYSPVIVVDAKSGEVILRYNTVLTMNKAKIYPTNPVKSPTLVEVTLPVESGATELTNKSVKALNCIDRKTLKQTQFTSDKVHICDLLQTAIADASTGDFLAQPASDTDPEDDFSEISIFHHTNRAYSLFRGFQSSLNVNGSTPLPAVANLRIPQGIASGDATKYSNPDLPLAPFQNAFFSPKDPIFSSLYGFSGGAMWFGQGPVRDYSYDGDVIYHEFTHSVVEVTLQLQGNPHLDEFGTSYSPGAMNEALADYFSSALAGDPAVGEYASGDIAPGMDAIRVLTNSDTCSNSIAGEVHQDSTVFSGSLWEVRKDLSENDQAEFDAAVYAAMNSADTGDLAYEDLGNLIVDAVRASTLGDGAADKLSNAFNQRGVFPRCTRIIEYTGTPLSGPPGLQGLWLAPGTSTTGLGKAKLSPGVVQFHQKLPFGAMSLAVSFKKVNIGSGGFGGGTPFAPKLLVRFGSDPVAFEYNPFKAADDVLSVDPDPDGLDYSASIEVPAGSEDVHVMIASSGQADGAYTNVGWSVTVDPNAVPPTPDAGTSTSQPVTAAKGCACGDSGADVIGLAGMLLGLARMRRRR